MVSFQKPHHIPINVIRQGMNDGYAPSIRTTLKLGGNLCSYLNRQDIKTVRALALLSEKKVREILSHRDDPDNDLACIEEALKNVGLKLGMTREEFKHYKKAS